MAQQQRSETHSRILQAALACFSRAGYDATGVAEICTAAGVSKGAFYHHFPTKQAVFITLLNDWLSSLDAQFEAVRAQPISVPDALRGMALTARQVFADARGQLPLFLEFWTQASRDPVIWEKTVEPYQRYLAYFAGLIRAGIAEGSLRPVAPEAAARAVIALAVGLLAQALTSPDQTDWTDAAVEGVEMLLRGIEI
jgi:AcrR family transcriptional regulator